MCLVTILNNKYVLKAQCGKKKGQNIHINMGMYQGNCFLAVLFIVYLEKSIKPLNLQWAGGSF